MNKLYLYAAIGIALAALVWRYQWLSKKVNEQSITIAETQAQLESSNKLILTERAKIVESNNLQLESLQKLKAKTDETESYRTCIANGTCVMRIKAHCPAVPSSSSNSSEPAATYAVIDGADRQAIFKLRDDSALVQENLSLCVKTLQAERK